MSYPFAFLYCSWGLQVKSTEVVCHSLLLWTTFCQTSPPWPARLVWPHTAWLSFTELDKAVVCVIRLTSVLWLWFQRVCPLMPSFNIYRLTSVCLILDVGYLFMAAPAKHSCCSLPWMRGISAAPPDLEHGVVPLGLLHPHSHHSLDLGLLLYLRMNRRSSIHKKNMSWLLLDMEW